MRLDRLLDGIEVVTTAGDPAAVEVAAVTHDSRTVSPGALFCCVRGASVDGHDLAPAAVVAGARALLCERPVGADAVQVVVPDVRAVMGPVAAAFHGHPSRHLTVVGVTGTNGKTTTVHLLRSVLEAAGRPAAVIGTLTGARTTPEGPELQARLAALRAEGTEAVCMEVSSHALAMRRVDGTRFEVAAFTNLSRDHLDFHASVEDYFAAKARLFDPELASRAVVNVDDAHGRLLRDAARLPTTGYALADAEELSVGVASSRFRWRGTHIEVPLGGRFNVANALAAATVAVELGIGPDTIARGLRTAGPVAGRFEAVEAGQPFRVIVDYAHTPDGLDQLLQAARGVSRGRVWVVFGCGGDRDPAKRPAMGAVAVGIADQVVLTSDNPRGEDPGAIISGIMDGIPDASSRTARGDLVVEPDRRAAIAAALGRATPGDIVVIAGKGHETTQTAGDRVVAFDDREVAREELARLAEEADWSPS